MNLNCGVGVWSLENCPLVLKWLKLRTGLAGDCFYGGSLPDRRLRFAASGFQGAGLRIGARRIDLWARVGLQRSGHGKFVRFSSVMMEIHA